MPESSDRNAFIFALVITLGLGWGTVYFVQAVWPLLPGWLALILFIILAAAVIGYPIYALARWSDRYLQRRKPPLPSNRSENDRQ
jgi:membrane protein implicated in regulation of membrane protease activity